MILITLQNALKRGTNFLKLSKVPGYLSISLGLLFFGPALPWAYSLKFLAYLVAVPLVYEAFAAALTISLVAIFRLFSPRFLNNERLLEYAITQDNENLAIEVVNRSQSPDILVSYGVKLIASNTNRPVFNAIVARLAALSPNQLAYNDNQLLRASIYHGRNDLFLALLNNEAVRNNADANNNEALKEACIKGDSELVSALLAIPAVNANAHHNLNEALRLAQRNNHIDIVQLLLANQQVASSFGHSGSPFFSLRRSAEFGIAPASTQAPQRAAQAYYFNIDNFFGFGRLFGRPRNNQEEDQSLNGMARSESSTISFNQRQDNAFHAMQAQYRTQFNQKGINNIFEEIKGYLRTEYALHPAKTFFGIHLPFNIGIFSYLVDNQGYYQHRAHTAYRYLFLRPNHWASLINTYPLSEQAREEIAYMWLAATDKSRKLPENYNREQILGEFTQSLYELCRAHNYDRSMPVLRSRRTDNGTEETYWENEHYDDLEGDKPTCGYGSRQRIFQFYMVFLNEDPSTRPLTSDLAKTKFVQEMVNESTFAGTLYNKLKLMDVKALDNVRNAIEKKIITYEDLSVEEKTALDNLKFKHIEIDAIVSEFKTYYGAARIEQIRSSDQPTVGLTACASYEQMIRKLANEADVEFAEHLMRSIDQLKLKLNDRTTPSPVLFSAPVPTSAPSNTPANQSTTPENRSILNP